MIGFWCWKTLRARIKPIECDSDPEAVQELTPLFAGEDCKVDFISATPCNAQQLSELTDKGLGPGWVADKIYGAPVLMLTMPGSGDGVLRLIVVIERGLFCVGSERRREDQRDAEIAG